MKTKELSVVIITRDRKKELLECLQSIFSQSRSPDEIIVVDNGSRQKVRNIHGIKLVRSETNLGGAGGRNLGLLHTTGKYILFMDDDAVADKDMLKELHKIITKDSK